ncbi:hypothetical protein CYMTET_26377 [Cymbomonas tetramitiformis]|uniref:Uncharacterized protein n=1 Tax=Cymbomonas tetramitiformis TaxID=36881 RepID=A0AAE0FS78_9CHLO|nr:hypothetical protein CYMTET_26377 [Cymbomonas tetramitiformis]
MWTATPALVRLGLLEETTSGGRPVFAGARDWPLPAGVWSSVRTTAKKRLTAARKWGSKMLASIPAAAAPLWGLRASLLRRGFSGRRPSCRSGAASYISGAFLSDRPGEFAGEEGGLVLRVYPAVSLDAQERKLVLGKDGRVSWTASNTSSRYTTLLEWERGFCTMMRKVQSDMQHRLMLYFKEWFAAKAGEYGATVMIKFYDYLILRMEEDGSITFNITCYTELCADYSREQGLRPQGSRHGGNSWVSPSKGSKGRGSKGKGGQQTDQPAAQRDASANEEQGDRDDGMGTPRRGLRRRGEAIAAGGARGRGGRVSSTVTREVEDIEDGDAEEDVMSMAGALEFEAVENDKDGAGEGAPDTAWWEHLTPTDSVPMWGALGAPAPQEPRAGWSPEPGVFDVAPVPVSDSEPDKWCVQEGQEVGAAVPLLTERAHLVAAVFADWHDVQFLVRGVACGVGWPSRQVEGGTPFRVPNYVGQEHMEAMAAEIEKESKARHIFPAGDRMPWGISALGMVEKVCNGKVKYHPVWDYSRPRDTGVNARIDLEKDKFSTMKDAYALRRPRYLDDFFMVSDTEEAAEEHMMLLVEKVSFLGFRVNSAKCEGLSREMEFWGVLLASGGPRCTAAISKDRVKFVVATAKALREKAARAPVRRKEVERLWGLLAFCSQVVWGLPLYFHRGFSLLAASSGRAKIKVTPPVLEYLDTIEGVIRRYNGRAVVLYREDVKEDFWATDASGTLGMGEVMDTHFFLHSWEDDRDDWMLSPADSEFGPFTLDACVAPSRANSFCAVSWSREEDARVQAFDGHQAWGNLPFSAMHDIVLNFLRCKKRQQMGTTATSLVPVWGQDRGRAPDPTWELVSSLPRVFKVVRRWRRGTHLFTAPALKGDEVLRALQREQKRYEEDALAQSTKGSYSTGARAFVTFCISFACLGLADMSLSAAILVGFFGMFRKDNLTVGKEDAYNTRAALVRDDVLFVDDGEAVWIRVHYSKTIQCGERCHWVPLRRVPRSVLCPVPALGWLIMATADRDGDAPLLVTQKLVGRKVQVVPLTHAGLVKGIKRLAEAVGPQPEMFAGHSLRRGGAITAQLLEVQSVYIKAQGDWRSDCYERYCEMNREQRLILPRAMAEATAALNPDKAVPLTESEESRGTSPRRAVPLTESEESKGTRPEEGSAAHGEQRVQGD